jgi:hypothetical protein
MKKEIPSRRYPQPETYNNADLPTFFLSIQIQQETKKNLQRKTLQER